MSEMFGLSLVLFVLPKRSSQGAEVVKYHCQQPTSSQWWKSGGEKNEKKEAKFGIGVYIVLGRSESEQLLDVNQVNHSVVQIRNGFADLCLRNSFELRQENVCSAHFCCYCC
jgi:hypothetical protein